MHGRRADRERTAEQHARAAASGALHEAGADEPLGPRQQAHEGEAEDDEDESCHPLEQELVVEEAGPDELGADAEGDEDGREAEHERDAREHDPPRRPALAEPVRLDGGDGREIARHERQHARGEERDEARDQGNQRLGRLHRSVLVPGELLVHPALEVGIELGALAGRRRSRVDGSTSRRARRRRRCRRASAASGRSQASRSKPRFGGSASTAGPNWSTSFALICAALSPAAIRARMNAFIRVAIGELDWSSVVWQVGQTISASRSAWRGGSAADGRAGERER